MDQDHFNNYKQDLQDTTVSDEKAYEYHVSQEEKIAGTQDKTREEQSVEQTERKEQNAQTQQEDPNKKQENTWIDSPYGQTPYSKSWQEQQPLNHQAPHGQKPQPPGQHPCYPNDMPPQNMFQQSSDLFNGFSIASLVFGIVSFTIVIILSWFFWGSLIGLGLGITGIIFGVMGRKHANQRGIATAGFLISIISVIIGSICFIAFMTFYFSYLAYYGTWY